MILTVVFAHGDRFAKMCLPSKLCAHDGAKGESREGERERNSHVKIFLFLRPLAPLAVSR